MPIIIRNPTPGSLDEYIMLEIQGDLHNRNEEFQDSSGEFIGDVFYNKFGNPILVIGHHILFGVEKKLQKPFAVIEKVEKTEQLEEPDSQPNASISILDTTVNIENRTKSLVEYHARAVIKKKLVFNQRPRPIINAKSLT